MDGLGYVGSTVRFSSAIPSLVRAVLCSGAGAQGRQKREEGREGQPVIWAKRLQYLHSRHQAAMSGPGLRGPLWDREEEGKREVH
jgi:hypothetical protein